MSYTKPLKLPGEEKSLHRLTIFSFLWACQAFVHLDFSWHWLQSGKILGYIAMAAVILLLFNPRSVSLLGFMALASFADNVSHWPKLSNHTFASGLINGTILLAVLWTLYQNRRQIGKPGWSWYTLGLNDREATNALLERFAPIMRAAVIIIYLFAVLHKLNWDFLNPAISCGVAMFHDLTSRLPFSPDYAWAPLASIWATLAIELALPVLLLFRKTRHYALALGLPFHLMLGLIGHRKFSAFIFACYFLFTEEKFTEALNERARALRRSHGKKLVAALVSHRNCRLRARLVSAKISTHAGSDNGVALELSRLALVVACVVGVQRHESLSGIKNPRRLFDVQQPAHGSRRMESSLHAEMVESHQISG
ncbi:MAG: hypothetical protein DYG95_29785 [Chlorobi bacterium CHB1]|nr:hypothetical protein [Chlorobi bacterium CHB1]